VVRAERLRPGSGRSGMVTISAVDNTRKNP
jgi:hypothetical protein